MLEKSPPMMSVSSSLRNEANVNEWKGERFRGRGVHPLDWSSVGGVQLFMKRGTGEDVTYSETFMESLP